jgi:outer membrane protein assembly factor BamB
MGHLHCLDAKTGAVIWSHDLAKELPIDMPIWGLTNSPLVEGDVVVLQAGAKDDGACVIAFHKDTGKEVQ